MVFQFTWFDIFQTVVFPGILLFFILAFLSEWLYRKFYARFQMRIGPASAGPSGVLQSFADFFKTALKEEIVPETVNPILYRFLPIFAPIPILLGLFFLPITWTKGIISSSGDLYMIIFILTSFAAIQITLGWASGSKFALIGASRSGLQLVSFGIPLIFSLLDPVIRAGSFSLSDIVSAQSGVQFGFIPKWNAFGLGFISFLIFGICALAEMEKPPFDSPEAETEIAGGWTLEYSGRGYAFIILSENLKVVFLTGLGVTMFLGGPLGPTFGQSGYILSSLYFIYFLIKYIVLLFFISLLSSGMARFKVRQIVFGTWSYLTPIAVINVILLFIIGGN